MQFVKLQHLWRWHCFLSQVRYLFTSVKVLQVLNSFWLKHMSCKCRNFFVVYERNTAKLACTKQVRSTLCEGIYKRGFTSLSICSGWNTSIWYTVWRQPWKPCCHAWNVHYKTCICGTQALPVRWQLQEQIEQGETKSTSCMGLKSGSLRFLRNQSTPGLKTSLSSRMKEAK